MTIKDIGIDLGTRNTLISVRGEGIVVNEPSCLAIDRLTHRPIAYGQEAYQMIGRTSQNIDIIFPLQGGVIADFNRALMLLSYFVQHLHIHGLLARSDMLICVPTNITSIEEKAIIDVAKESGARQVFVEEEPKVAAVGAGLNIFAPVGHMIVDMGGGTTDAAVLSLGSTVQSASIKVAGDVLDEAIVQMVRNKYQLLIGESMAEKIKFKLGRALPDLNPQSMRVAGRDILTGMPKTQTVTSKDVYGAIDPSLMKIEEIIHSVLERTPPELASDIYEGGIYLTGGCALILGLAERFTTDFEVNFVVATSPLEGVAIGAGDLLEKLAARPTLWDLIQRIFRSKRVIKNPTGRENRKNLNESQVDHYESMGQ